MSPSQDDRKLDAALVRSLAAISGGNVLEFAHQTPPPADVAEWIARADFKQVCGALCLIIRRWLELRPTVDTGQQASNGPEPRD